jgi:hypothetical protein
MNINWEKIDDALGRAAVGANLMKNKLNQCIAEAIWDENNSR